MYSIVKAWDNVLSTTLTGERAVAAAALQVRCLRAGILRHVTTLLFEYEINLKIGFQNGRNPFFDMIRYLESTSLTL